MAAINFDYHPQFFTATILEWKPLLKDDGYKDIVIESLQFFKKRRQHNNIRVCDHAQSHPLNMADTRRL